MPLYQDMIIHRLIVTITIVETTTISITQTGVTNDEEPNDPAYRNDFDCTGRGSMRRKRNDVTHTGDPGHQILSDGAAAGGAIDG